MNNILKDIWTVISSMTLIDFILYFAVITLIVLIVSLIYVIYTEKLENTSNVVEEVLEDVPSSVPVTPKEENLEFDLMSVIEEINENPKPLIDMTLYEEEQEKKAIISYDELLKSANKEINISKEELIDDVIPVKKLTLSSIESPKEITYIPKEPKIEIDSVASEKPKQVPLFSYEKEEAFLRALQQLNELLN